LEKLAPLQKIFYYILNVDPALPQKGTRHSKCTCYLSTTLFGGYKVLQYQHGQWVCNSTWPRQPQAATASIADNLQKFSRKQAACRKDHCQTHAAQK